MPIRIINCSGCLAFFLLFLVLTFLFKHWAVILLFVVSAYLITKLSKFGSEVGKEIFKEKDYVSKPGKTYKQCAYCDAKSDRKASVCTKCGKPFE